MAEVEQQPADAAVEAPASGPIEEANASLIGADLDDITFEGVPDEAEETPADNEGVKSETTDAEQPDTDTETVGETDGEAEGGEPADTETETGSDNLAGLMDNLGLSNKYDSPEKVLEAHVHLQRKAETDRQHNQLLTKILAEMQAADKPQPETAPSINDDELVEMLQTNPREAIEALAKEMGFVRKDEIEPIGKDVEAIKTESQFREVVDAINAVEGLGDVAKYVRDNRDLPEPGMNKKWDAMVRIAEHSGLTNAPIALNIGTLNKLYEYDQIKKNQKTTVAPVPPHKKAGAKTTSTGRQTSPAGSLQYPDGFLNWEPEKMLEWGKKHGLVD
jgi:hypothetical protein